MQTVLDGWKFFGPCKSNTITLLRRVKVITWSTQAATTKAKAAATAQAQRDRERGIDFNAHLIGAAAGSQGSSSSSSSSSAAAAAPSSASAARRGGDAADEVTFRMMWKTSMVAKRKYPPCDEAGKPMYVREFLKEIPVGTPGLLEPVPFAEKDEKKIEALARAQLK